MDDAGLYGRMLAGMEAFFGLVGEGSAAGWTIRRDDLLASVCPELPRRSVFNSVVYRSTAALEAALGELAATYDEAGVLAWTVWTPQRDLGAREALERAGHRLDATPQAMAARLEEIDVAGGAEGLDWERAQTVDEMCAILEPAFGWELGPASRVFARLPEHGHVYVARADGLASACVFALDAGDDCGIWNVGTLPETRGRGLGTGLMRQALIDARERCCATTSLQATAMGRPLYARLGYRELGVIEMWERRRGGGGVAA
ncbi:MAG: GNAT family N-acetyltransferase [Solirubrobacteraceae bacterium]